MKKSTLSILICFGMALAATSLVSLADDATRKREIAQRFAKCDTNHGDRLTKEEAKGCMPRVYGHFAYLDSGNKGYVTVAEIYAAAD